MRFLSEMLYIGFWVFAGALVLWGMDSAGFLPSGDQTSLAVLQVDFPEVYEIWKKGEAIFVDARPSRYFEVGHIPGAVNVPLNRVEKMLSRLPEDPNVRLITYCESIDCPNGYQLMNRLIEKGYRNVQLFPRGLRTWIGLGYPIQKRE